MRVTILGSGTMMPTKKRYPAAYLVEDGATRVLLDCGHLTLARLLERDIDVHSITLVGITHFHTDHFSHLLPLVHARWVDDRLHERQHQPLTVLGPPTLQERWQKLREVSWPEPEEDYPLTFREGTTPLVTDSLTIQPFTVTHVPWFPSVGYRVTARDGKSLVYTGDMNAQQDTSFEQTIAGADVLVIEAAADKPAATHFTADQAVALAQRCHTKRVVLTHISDDRLAYATQVMQQYPSFVTVAEDGLTFEI